MQAPKPVFRYFPTSIEPGRFDLFLKLAFRHVGDAGRLHLLVLGHASFAGCTFARQNIGAVASVVLASACKA
jgi:hypothetical protein